MKINPVSWLRSSLLLATAIPLQSALARLPEPTEPPPSNAVPIVRLLSPHDGAVLLAGQNIHICAAALYFTDAVAQVEFFAGSNSLALVTNGPSFWDEDSGKFFCFTWSNLVAGTYTLTAVGTDLSGTSVTSAPVDISVVTNLPPRVYITKPATGSTIHGPTNVTICASAHDPDGTVASVEFFEDGTSLGVVPTPPVVYVTNSYGVFPIRSPYCVVWSNAPLGTFTLTAVATDNEGATSTSKPVTITLVSNLPPRVHLERPFNGSTFQAPGNIEVCAAARDIDGSVATVEFFAGSTSLGVVTNPSHTSWWEDETFYCLTWSNVTAGSYLLTAVATDNGGLTATSGPVNIKVLPPPPPSVKITTPMNGATLYRGLTPIFVCAAERHFTNPIVHVEFFAGTNSIGITTNSPYSCIQWKNAPTGAFSLTAVATENTGDTVTSPPVNVTITTNRPPRIWDW